MDTTSIIYITAAVSTGLIVFFEFYTRIWINIPRRVTCWFCHSKSRVQLSDINNWTCKSCDQYNGFNKDGSYNKEIPNQFDEKLNVTITSIGRKRNGWKEGQKLCSKCNYYQELKIKQLASFTPLSEKNFDVEIEHFRKQLEKSYELCNKCEQLVIRITSTLPKIMGIRRLVNSTKKVAGVIKNGVTLHFSLFISLLLGSIRLHQLVFPDDTVLQLPIDIPYLWSMDEIAVSLTFIGIVIHTVQCYRHPTLWAYTNWFAWAIVSILPQFVYNTQTLSSAQLIILAVTFFSIMVVQFRRRQLQKLLNSKRETINKKTEKRRAFQTLHTSTPLRTPETFPSTYVRKPLNNENIQLLKEKNIRGNETNHKNESLLNSPLLKPTAMKFDLGLSRLSLGTTSVHRISTNTSENPFLSSSGKSLSGYGGRQTSGSISTSSGVSLTPPPSPRHWHKSSYYSSHSRWPHGSSSFSSPDTHLQHCCSRSFCSTPCHSPNYHHQAEASIPKSNLPSPSLPYITSLFLILITFTNICLVSISYLKDLIKS